MWLAHHGIKGQKWGVRNGPPYPLDEKSSNNRFYADHVHEGRLFCDSVLKKNTIFKRVQVGKDYERFEFYATHEKQDVDYFAENFTKNLIRRGKDKNNIYQIELKNTKDLKIPSITKAAKITSNLLYDRKSRNDIKYILKNSAKSISKNPEVYKIFTSAYDMVDKIPPDKLTTGNKRVIYNAINLSMVCHSNKHFTDTHQKVYDLLKRNGYGAIVDINDTYYSNLKGKHPIIVFDLDSIEHTKSNKYNPYTKSFK